MNMSVERFTLAVGQGLFHYEEVWRKDQSRPLTIVYDAGSLNSKVSGTTPNMSMNKIRNRIQNNAKSTIDYLVLSHFHKDHFNLMRQLIKGFKINYFIAPLLNEKNNIEIAATVDSWFYGQNPNLESHFYNEAAKNFVKNGSEGFKNSFFSGREKEDMPESIFFTNDPESSNSFIERKSIIHKFPAVPNRGETKFVLDDKPISIRSTDNRKYFWRLAFFHYAPVDTNKQIYKKAQKKFVDEVDNQCKILKKQDSNQFNASSKNSDNNVDDSINSGDSISDNSADDSIRVKASLIVIQKRLYLPVTDTKNYKTATFEDVFGDANPNMTSLCLYSGAELRSITHVKKKLKSNYDCWPDYIPVKLSSTARGPALNLPSKTKRSLRLIFKESSSGRYERYEILKQIYDQCEQEVRNRRQRSKYWAWLGLGDINFTSSDVVNKFISHFNGMQHLLQRVGCCSAPHHGSWNGFSSTRVPNELKSAICTISCDPEWTMFKHPHSQAMESIISGGMIPVLVNKKLRSTFHETIVWS